MNQEKIRKMNQEKIKRPTVIVRLIIVLAIGITYGWSAPRWLGPHRHDSSASSLFLWSYAITMVTAIVITLGRKPGRAEIITLVMVLLAWIYLFFFVMLNSFGS
jgi:cytochrome c biogenesis factor